MAMGLVNEWCQFVEHVGAATADRGGKFYYVGLDLGQAADYSALAILERHGREDDCEFRCRHLQRWALKTPYPAIVADTTGMMNSAELRASRQPTLAVDATGVGAPVVDLFKRERMSAAFYPVTITAGDTPSYDSGAWRVPKRDLVSTAQVALQTGRLKIAPELPDADALVRELQNFQVKINLETAHDSYGAWREGTHDDLVLAVALALWIAKNERDNTVIVFRR